MSKKVKSFLLTLPGPFLYNNPVFYRKFLPVIRLFSQSIPEVYFNFKFRAVLRVSAVFSIMSTGEMRRAPGGFVIRRRIHGSRGCRVHRIL